MTKRLRTTCRLMSLCACLVVFSMPLVSAQDRSQYRNFRIGGDLRSIAEQSGVAPPMARVIPPEPAGLQELAWRPHYVRGVARQSDAVARVTFGFYNDQLFRIVIDYERLRTEGMTEADMVGAISKTYGPPTRRVVPHGAIAERTGQDGDLLVASWEDADYSIGLLRMPDSSAFRMIVASNRLAALAQAAGAVDVRLDWREAPQREAAAGGDDVEGGHAVQEKSRLANKAAFKP